MSHLSEWNPVDIPSKNLKSALQANFRTSSQFSDDDCITNCLLYTSDAADDLLCVDLGGRRIIKKKLSKNK